jgi:WD40 repeat protein
LWVKRGRRDEEVWQGDALRDARRAVEQKRAEMPSKVLDFVSAGEQKQRRLQRARRARLIGGFVLLAAVAVGAIFVAVTLSRQKRAVDAARKRAVIKRADALVEGAQGALIRRQPLEARAKLRTALEAADCSAARILWWRLKHNPLEWKRALGAGTWAVSFSPDQRQLAVAVSDGNVYLFDVVTRELRKVLRGHTSDLRAVVFSPDGKLLASSGFDNTVRIWRVTDGKTVAVLREHSSLVGGVAFSADGARLASASRDRTVRLWDVKTGKQLRVLTGHSGGVWAVAFAPGGRFLASAGDDRTLRFWRLEDGTTVKVLRGHKAEVHDLTFSPDGRLAATASWDGTVILWNIKAGMRVRVLRGHKGEAWRVSFSPDGTRVASTGSDGTVRIWNAASGRLERTLAGHSGDSRGVGFSPDGRLLASTGSDKTVRLWKLSPAAAPPAPQGHTHGVLGAAFDPSGTIIASASIDQTLRLWDVRTGRQRAVFEGHANDVSNVAFSPNGRRLASTSADGSLRIWDPKEGGQTRVHVGQLGRVEDLSFHPKGTRIAVLVRNRLRVWDTETGLLIRQFITPGAVLGAADVDFSPDGRLLAAAGRDRTVRVWDAETGKLTHVFRGHTDVVYGISFSPDGTRLASGSYDRTVRLWDVKTRGQQTTTPYREFLSLNLPHPVEKVAFHPDGKHLGVSTTASRGVAYLLRLADGRRLALRGHHGPVNRIAFTPDGKLAVTASQDGTIRTWHTSTGRPYWRAPLLVRDPPEMYTHLGWVRLGDQGHGAAVQHRPDRAKWREAVARRARSASEDPTGRLLCFVSFDGAMELWDRKADRRLKREQVEGLRKTVATPDGCLTLTARGRIRWHSTSGRVRELTGRGATTMVWDRSGILAAGARRLLLFDRFGRPVRTYSADTGLTAVYRAHGYLIAGFKDGNVELIHPATGRRRAGFSLQEVPSSPVLRMTAGPRRTLVVGFANGAVGLWDLSTGVRLNRAQLHGPVVHLVAHRHRIYAATDLGSFLSWDLSTLRESWCSLLKDIWLQVPVGWEGSRAVRRPPPRTHPCRNR